MDERGRLLKEQVTMEVNYLELMESCSDLEEDVVLAVLDNCIKQLKHLGNEILSTESQLLTAGLQKLLTKKIYETECDTYEIKIPVAEEECEPSVCCRFCDEVMEQSKLAEHQKQICKLVTIGELSLPEKACSEYVYKIHLNDIECILCGFLCQTIADKLSHEDTFGHLSHTSKINLKVLDTIYCSLCCENIPNNDVQCHKHIQGSSHRRLQEPVINWYKKLVRYHSLLHFVRCITCKENLHSQEEVVEHHSTKHYKTKRQKSVCRVWCTLCDRCDDINNLTAHFSIRDKLSVQYCQLCDETVRGRSIFVSHVKSCTGERTSNELIIKEFHNPLILEESPVEPISNSLPKLPVTPADPFSENCCWCNCCGDFFIDGSQHYHQSCKPVVENFLSSTKAPSIRSLISIVGNGVRCNSCKKYSKNLELHMQHEKRGHDRKNLDGYSTAFIHCSICYDYIPDDNISYKQHIASSDHRQLKRKTGWLKEHTYIWLFFMIRCLVCKINLFSISNLRRHHKEFHAPATFDTAWCHSCDTAVYFDEIEKHSNLVSHQEWNSREMACLLCPTLCTGYSNLLCHVRECRKNFPMKPTSDVECPVQKNKIKTQHQNSVPSQQQLQSLVTLSNLKHTATSNSQKRANETPAANFSFSNSKQNAFQQSPVMSSEVNHVKPSVISTASVHNAAKLVNSKRSIPSKSPSPSSLPKAAVNGPSIIYATTSPSSKSNAPPRSTSPSSGPNIAMNSSSIRPNYATTSPSYKSSVPSKSTFPSSEHNAAVESSGINDATTQTSSKRSAPPSLTPNSSYRPVASTSSTNSVTLSSSSVNSVKPSTNPSPTVKSTGFGYNTTTAGAIRNTPSNPTTNATASTQSQLYVRRHSTISSSAWASPTRVKKPEKNCVIL